MSRFALRTKRLVYAVSALWALMPAVPVRGHSTAMFDAAVYDCVSHGITSFVDAAVDRQTLALYRTLAERGELPIRINAMLVPGRDGSDHAFIDQWLEHGPTIGLGNNHLTVPTLKLFVEDALGSHGAWLLSLSSDTPGNLAKSLLPTQVLYETEPRIYHGSLA